MFGQSINFEWAHANKTAPYEIVSVVETQITLVYYCNWSLSTWSNQLNYNEKFWHVTNTQYTLIKCFHKWSFIRDSFIGCIPADEMKFVLQNLPGQMSYQVREPTKTLQIQNYKSLGNWWDDWYRWQEWWWKDQFLWIQVWTRLWQGQALEFGLGTLQTFPCQCSP